MIASGAGLQTSRAGSRADGARKQRSPGRLALLWRRRAALKLLVRRDLKVRYAGSVLGYLWTVLEPLLMAGVYWVIFTQIITRSVGAEPYIVFLLAGLLPWTWFNGACSELARALRAEAKLVRSTNVPRQIWVFRVVFSKGLEFLFSLPVLVVFVLLNGAETNWRVVYFIPATLMLCALLLGIGLILAPLAVLVRDIERIVRILLRLGFYASPVVYAVRDVPAPWDALFALNPVAGIIELFRAAFFPQFLDYTQVATSAVISIGVLLVGWVTFARLERVVLKEL